MFRYKQIKAQVHQFKIRWNSLNNWPSFQRRWTKAKSVLRFAFLAISLVLAFVPALFEYVSIIRAYEGIELPSGSVSINLDFIEPQGVYISFPFKVKNSGFYDLIDLSFEITLTLFYTDRFTDVLAQEQILSSSSESFRINKGKSIFNIFHRDYSWFNWGNIGNFLEKVDDSKEILVILDLELSFYIEWVEHDKIIFSNMDLTGENISPSINDKTLEFSENNLIFKYELFYFTISSIVTLSVFSLLSFLKRNKAKNNTIHRIKKRVLKNNLKRKSTKNALAKIIVYIILMVGLDIYLLASQINSKLVSSDYILRYEFIILISIFILCIISILYLMPLIKPRIFLKYSLNEGFRSLSISILNYIYFIVFLANTVAWYQIGDDTILIRDSFPSFIPSLILIGLYVLVKLLDLFNLSKYKQFYQKVRIDEERRLQTKSYIAKNENEFKKLIFDAIYIFESSGREASLNQLRYYFDKNHISKRFNSLIKLDKEFLLRLTYNQFLESKISQSKSIQQESYIIYHLTGKARSFLKDYINSDDSNSESLLRCPICDSYYLRIWQKCPLCI